VALVTSQFWELGEVLAQAQGMPGLPRILLPYPVAGTGMVRMREIAADVVDDVIRALTGTDESRPA
jgi:hypothetical protein